MTTRIGLTLEPLDVLFFRDGRPFEAGIRVGGMTIVPQTLAGALRTALLDRAGCDFAALGAAMRGGKDFEAALAAQSSEIARTAKVSTRGPWFCRGDQPLLAAPAVLMRDDESGQVACLGPLKEDLPGWSPEHPAMHPLWLALVGRYERVSGFLTLAGIGRFLAGSLPITDEIVPFDELAAAESRTGIAVGMDSMTVETGHDLQRRLPRAETWG
jgi:CRISPR-associated protein Cmr3